MSHSNRNFLPGAPKQKNFEDHVIRDSDAFECPDMERLSAKITTLAAIVQGPNKSPLIASPKPQEMINMVQEAMDTYQLNFSRACSEIQTMKQELGELRWTNRELKVAL